MNRILILVMFVVMTVAGCKTTPQKGPGNVLPAPKAITDRRVVLEPAVANWFRVLKVDTSTAGRFMRLEISFQNASRSLQRFSYEIVWIDGKGNIIPDISSRGAPWTLLAGEASALIITAPTPLAKEFRAKISAAPIQ